MQFLAAEIFHMATFYNMHDLHGLREGSMQTSYSLAVHLIPLCCSLSIRSHTSS